MEKSNRRKQWRAKTLLSCFAYLGLSLWFCLPFLASGSNLGILDWDVHFLYYGSFFKSVYEYGTWPFWNPWYCGGNVLWQNPQIALLSPTYLFAPFTGIPLAIKLNLLVHFFIALTGMHLLATRVFRIRATENIFFLAIIFAFSGGCVLHFAAGHTNFIPMFYTPWIYLFILKAFDNGQLKYAFAAAVPAALMIYNGGFHILSMTLVGLGIYALFYIICRRRSFIRICWVLGSFLLAMALYAAPKLLPTFLFTASSKMLDARGSTSARDFVSDQLFWQILADPSAGIDTKSVGFPWGWWEYGNYIGVIAIAVFLGAAAFVSFSQRQGRSSRFIGLSLFMSCVVLFYIVKGQFSPSAPSYFLQELPVLNKFRIFSRYILVFNFFALMMTAWTLARTERFIGRNRSLRAFLGTILVLGALAPLMNNRKILAEAFPSPPLKEQFSFLKKPSEPIPNYEASPYGGMFSVLMKNETIPNCYEPMQVRSSYISRQNLIMVEPKQTIESVQFQPNRIKVIVRAEQKTRVYLNQNYIEGWTSSAGDLRYDELKKSYFAEVDAGRSQLVFRFLPNGLIVGWMLFALSLACTYYLRNTSIREGFHRS